MAIVCFPLLLIADEPTTALDVTTQRQYLRLLKKLQAETGMAMMFITHDLGIVARMCDYVCVMYLGKVVERAPVRELWDHPRHPYTIALMEAVPDIKTKVQRLRTIEGMVPSHLDLPCGCNFHPRCARAIERCREAPPPEECLGDAHYVSCWRASE